MCSNNSKIDNTLADWLERAVREQAPKEGVRIVELGCGQGERLDALSRFGEVVGVSESEDELLCAQHAHPSASVLRASLCDLPFDEEFDIAFSESAFSLIADQVGLLKSVARALKLDGTLIVKMGGAGNLARMQQGLAEALSLHSGGYSCQYCFPRESAYRCVLDIAGLTAVDMQTSEHLVPLPGGKEGLRLFAEEHFGKALGIYRPQDRDLVLHDLEKACRDDLWSKSSHTWMADVCLLRFVAKKSRRALGLGGQSQLSALRF